MTFTATSAPRRILAARREFATLCCPQYSIVKDHLATVAGQLSSAVDFCIEPTALLRMTAVEDGMVGLGRLELPTSPLSGVRSSHLSYRPRSAASKQQSGGAGRDRTGDLLNANQALSQLSYSPLTGGALGRDRR